MKTAHTFLSAGLIAGSLVSAASAAITIDNFEQYNPDNFKGGIATGFNSTPWLRLGGAVQDNMYVSSAAADGAAAVLDGTHSGLISAINLNSTGAQAIYMRNYNAATDFSSTDTVTVLASSTGLLPTNVQLLFFDAPIGDAANTSYITSTPVSLLGGGLAQTLTFGLNPTAMEISDGGNDFTPFADAIKHIYAIGFRFSSATGLNGTENVIVDDFQATAAATPEPASLGALSVGAAALLRRRRGR